jgi:REP element-mobilizing transposase RayT
MSVKLSQTDSDVTYFCTFTCVDWLPLIEITNLYDSIYNWFSLLHDKGNRIEGFVIMPNHVHLLLSVRNDQNIKQLLANGKRFLAYGVIKRLNESNNTDILQKLKAVVTVKEKIRQKKHRVFTPSSDIKACHNEPFLVQKLEYIHNNPISGKWRLANTATDYPHSSAAFYELNKQHPFVVVSHYKE